MRGISVANARRAPFSLALPALDAAGVAVIVIVVLLSFFSFLRSTDPDFWWHLRTGQLIADTGAVPKHDPFSFTAAGEPWVAHEWLSDLLIYGVESAFGYGGNVMLFTVLAAASLLLAHRAALSFGIGRWPAVGLLLWAALMSVLYWTVRPVVFTWLLFALYLNLLLEHRRGRNRLWLLPPLMLLWANLHAGYVIGLALVALYLVVSAGERFLMKERRDLKAPALALAACFLITAVNPNTVQLWLYPFIYLRPGNASMSFVTEWQSPDFHEPLYLFLGLAILALVAAGVFGRPRDLLIPGLAIAFTYLALQSSRHQPLFAMVFMVVMAAVVADRWPRLRFDPAKVRTPRSGLNWLLAASVAVIAAVSIGSSENVQLRATPRTDGEMGYPSAGAAFIRANYPEARMFNAYTWGGYLISELYPEQRVFIDGRVDMYGDDFAREYIGVVRIEPGWQETLDKYGIEVILIASDTPLVELLTATDETWERVFTGPVETIFARRRP